MAKPGQIIISESLYTRIKQQVKVKGPYKVKGKEQELRVYVLLDLPGEEK